MARSKEQRREEPGRRQERTGRDRRTGLGEEQGEVHHRPIGQRDPVAKMASEQVSCHTWRGRHGVHERCWTFPREQCLGCLDQEDLLVGQAEVHSSSASRQSKDTGRDDVALDLRCAAADGARERGHPRLLPPTTLGGNVWIDHGEIRALEIKPELEDGLA